MDHPHPSPSLPEGSPHFRIGTRGSDLALWQARYTQSEIEKHGGTAELVIISTQGDRIQEVTFDKMEGKGFFTKEIEAALLNSTIDVAVHSHKDLETTSPPGLEIAAVPKRGPVEDLLLIHPHAWDPRTPCQLKRGSTVGTSSHRRRAQLELLQPDLQVRALRGNVPTRVSKLRNGGYDAIILARAGVERLRLDVSDFRCNILKTHHFIPAPAQGALAIQMRSDDPWFSWMQVLHHEPTALDVERERSVLRALEGGCQLPFGAYHANGELRVFIQSNGRPFLAQISTSTWTVEASTQQALKGLKKQSPVNVLISKPKDHWAVLDRLATSAGVTLIHSPFIQCQATDDPLPCPGQEDDWIWLTSPAAVVAVVHLLDTFPGRIACAGMGTARQLESTVRKPDWIGSIGPEEAHKAFQNSDLLSTGRMFIPHSDRTLGRWNELAHRDKLIPWIAYRTTEVKRAVPKHDLAVLTSPTQLQGYLQSGGGAKTIITLGDTTSTACAEAGWESVHQASSSDEMDVWYAVFVSLKVVRETA